MNMIKTLLILFSLAALFPVAANAQAKGTKSFSFGLNGIDGDIAVSGELGYYFLENVETGVQASYGTEGEDLLAVGPYAEVYFPQVQRATDLPLLPFVGASGNYYNFDGDSTTGVTGYGGLRYLITPGVALYGAYEYRTAGDPIFVDDGELDDKDDRFTYGVQFLF